MKVLHLSHQLTSGGAARTVNLLHNALSSRPDISSAVLTHEGIVSPNISTSPLSRILLKSSNTLKRRTSSVILKLQSTSNYHYHSLSIFPSTTLSRINKYSPEIVHLHWVQGELISIRSISRIKQPICWTLHDSWPLCGAEHHPINPVSPRSLFSYSRISRPPSDKGPDLDRWIWMHKTRFWSHISPHFVAPSSWMARQLLDCPLFSNCDVTVIPNPINPIYFSSFTPPDSLSAHEQRSRFFQSDRKMILIGAEKEAFSDRNKSIEPVINLLESIASEHNILLVAFGSSIVDQPIADTSHTYPIIYLGKLEPDDLKLLYASADLLIVPSHIESFGLLAAEAQACGTPVIGRKGTGLDDIIQHGKSGFLFNDLSLPELSTFIDAIFSDHAFAQSLSINASRNAFLRFNLDSVLNQYLDVYETLLE